MTDWLPVGTKRLIAGTVYEAFPLVARLSSGRLLMTWVRADQHYATTSSARLARSDDDGATWGGAITLTQPDPTIPRFSAVGLATHGTRAAILTMTTDPYRGFLQTSADGGVTWTTPTLIGWQVSGWTFPASLTWWADGTTNGLMIACAYGAAGLIVITSTDAGATWTGRPSPSTDPGFNEFSIVRVGDHWLLLARRESASAIYAATSADLTTWTSLVPVIARAKSHPQPTVMPDGSIVMPVRDTTADLAAESWALAQSDDGGATWRVRALSTEWMMYGAIAATGPTTAVLVGASQVRGSSTRSDVWVRDLQLTPGPPDPLSRIDARGEIGTVQLRIPAGQTLSDPVTVRYQRSHRGTPRLHVGTLAGQAGAVVQVTGHDLTGYTLRLVVPVAPDQTTYIPAIWAVQGADEWSH